MEYNRYYNSKYNHYYNPRSNFTLSDALYSSLLFSPPEKEKFLEPVSIFHNDVVLTAIKKGEDYIENQYDNQFYVSLGIFNLDTSSVAATITKDNKLEITWSERAGKGRFTSKIPSYLVATSAPVLSYTGGVLDIRVPVKSKSENEAVFVGRLESK